MIDGVSYDFPPVVIEIKPPPYYEDETVPCASTDYFMQQCFLWEYVLFQLQVH